MIVKEILMFSSGKINLNCHKHTESKKIFFQWWFIIFFFKDLMAHSFLYSLLSTTFNINSTNKYKQVQTQRQIIV